MRWSDLKGSYDPIVVAWETNTARFIYVEISPSHIFRVKIDKIVNEEKEEVG